MYDSSEIQRFSLQGPILITPPAFGDARGLFSEVYRQQVFNEMIGDKVEFVQDNLSISTHAGTVRGLHGQSPPHGVGKLVQCLRGSVVDVAVDTRKHSPTFGQHVRVTLSAENRAQFWVPDGFLHGYATQSPDSLVFYKQTGTYAPGHEIAVKWDDPDLAIDWGVQAADATVSDKDADAQNFAAFDTPFTWTKTP